MKSLTDSHNYIFNIPSCLTVSCDLYYILYNIYFHLYISLNHSVPMILLKRQNINRVIHDVCTVTTVLTYVHMTLTGQRSRSN